MKEIKAYIRTHFLDDTVKRLQAHGAPGLTVVTVHPVGYGFKSRFSLSEQESIDKCIDISKIELVCDDDDLDKFVTTILDCAHTGTAGDGFIFVSNIEQAFRVKTLKKGTRLADVTD